MSEDKEIKDNTDEAKVAKPRSLKTLYFALMVTAIIFLPLTIVLLVCMAPTIVAVLVDRYPERTAGTTIGAMNLAGALPACFMLYDQGNKISDSVQIITTPHILLTSFGAAMVGWVIYSYVTPLVAGLMIKKNQRRLKLIEKRHKELVRKWGSGVSGQA